MGIIKRILRQTSYKLLTKLGAQRSSHQLVLNEPNVASPASGIKNVRSLHKKSSKRLRKSNKSREIPEALLLAAKNHLPPVQFHHVHGPNAVLSKNKFVARRTQSFCQALVFSNRVILPNERVYIKVLEIAKGWSGTIRFGFTSVDPATLRYQMPKHACPDMTSAGHTWARALADEVVRRNSVIHFSYNSNGYIHYGINNQDCGIFYANVNTSQHLWFIVDIYGLTAAVELIDPRIHNASSELDISRMDDDDMFNNRSTMFKSTSAMDHLYGNSLTSTRRSKKKRSRKTGTRHSALIYEQWPPESLLMHAPIATQFNPAEPFTQSMLPNLSSIILPTAQQNIYSPMPSMMNRTHPGVTNENEPHDYYQIMSNANESRRRPTVMSSAGVPSLASHPQMSASTSSALNSSTVNSSSNSSADLPEISQQLENFHMSNGDNNANLQHKQLTQASKSAKSTSSTELPVAAARRRPHTNTTQTNSKRLTDVGTKDQTKLSHVAGSNNSSKIKPTCSDSNSIAVKPRARHSLKNSQKPSNSRDNSSPPSKDCPICFERPINCVLYQCGHMCTCYECGVKQWRTQSRTCPICRTVIKDVIKTYMS